MIGHRALSEDRALTDVQTARDHIVTVGELRVGMEMHPMKRPVPSRRNIMVLAATFLMLGAATLAYGADGTDTGAARHIKGRTIFSDEFPRVKLTIRRGMRFIGTQRVNIHGNSEAEQYVFVRSGRDNTVLRFYLVQFEHFLPTNHFVYDYSTMGTAQVGDLQFNYDVKILSDLSSLLREDHGSDGQAMEQLLEKQRLVLPHKTVMVRMFQLPSTDHRTELMIIYGESLPENTTTPIRDGTVSLDTKISSSLEIFLEHARHGLLVETQK
jgi:hypothetical protein